MGSKFWLNDEDKAMVERVVGNAAAVYLAWSASNNVRLEFYPSGEDLEVQQSLHKIVEGSDWTYAIYWHVCNSKTGKSALVWGDGYCKEPNEGEGEDSNGCKIEKSEDEDDRRWVLHKIRACFGRLEDDNVAAKLDKVSDVEMFYLTSMYHTFLLDTPSIPSLSFNSGRTVWISEAISCLECYESRAYLAKLARLETVVFVPTMLGLVEIGSRKSIPEDTSVIQSAKFIAGKRSLAQTMAAPTILDREPSVGGSRSGPSSISIPPKVEDDSVDSSKIYGNTSNGYKSETPANGREEPSNHAEAETEGREKLDQGVSIQKGAQNVWCVKEDVALMTSWCLVSSEDNKRDTKRPSLWKRVLDLFHEARAENPEDINKRNVDSIKGRWRRLSENAKRWISAYEKAYSQKTSGMSEKNVEEEAIAIYEEGGGGKFHDSFVFDEVMSKHPKWAIKLDRESTRVCPENEEGNDESGGNSKRLRTSEYGDEYRILSKLETPPPSSGGSTIPRPTSGDQSSPTNEVAAEIRALRLARDSEVEVMRKLESARIVLELKKEERKMMKMNHIMLNTLLAKDHLSPEEEEMKRHLMAIVLRQ